MKDAQLVSVVLPCFNVEAYIGECIASVFRQTYSKLEVICVDNNSTDSTYKQLLKLKEQYPEITIEQEPKPGANAARNRGLELAKGEWVQFLDADDLLEPDKIEHQVNVIKNNPAVDFIAGSYIKLRLNAAKHTHIVCPIDKWIGLVTGNIGITSSNLFKKEALLQIYGWNEELQSSQETDLMFRLLHNGAKVYFDEEPFTIIRARESGSISQTNLEDNLIRFINVRIQVLEYLNACSETDRVVKEMVLQVLFDRIRELYNYNPKMSIQLYNRIIPRSFKPKVSEATTNSFLIAHKLLGFENAQRLKKYIR